LQLYKQFIKLIVVNNDNSRRLIKGEGDIVGTSSNYSARYPHCNSKENKYMLRV